MKKVFSQRSRNQEGGKCITNEVDSLRSEELNQKFWWSMTESLLSIPTSVFPMALMGASLGFYRFMKGSINAQDIFVCMQILSGLTSCLNAFHTSFQSIINLPNSVVRIEEILKDPVKSEPVKHVNRHPQAPIVQVQGTFSGAKGEPAVLRDINFSASKGEMIAVVSNEAASRSAFLGTMLGESTGKGKDISVEAPERVAYCGPTPWTIHGTLDENITLGKPVDEQRYQKALAAAMLPCARPEERSDATMGSIKSGPKMGKSAFYFFAWNMMAVACLVLSVVNVDWSSTTPVLGLLVILVQGLLHWSVLEIPLQVIATIFTSPSTLPRSSSKHLSLVLNYNLLATTEEDVDECLEHMYDAMMGNLGHNMAAVLVSATDDSRLKSYELEVRDKIRKNMYNKLSYEGRCWAGVEQGPVDAIRRQRFWSQFSSVDRSIFVEEQLHKICEAVCADFMVLHRQSRVLRKCGQYQDLMLLSAGEVTAFTYCDKALYGQAARNPGEPLFAESDDMQKVKGRNFDYTLVLDSDTIVTPGVAFELMDIAAAHPDHAIIQPAIKMHCEEDSTIFMQLEAMRQSLHEPMNGTVTSILGESSFYGQGLINNKAYVYQCLGSPEALI